MPSPNRQLLILDLDETLVYATDSTADAPLPRAPDFTVGPYAVLRRPHLSPFLACVFDWFDVAVWTSSTSAYAFPIVQNIFPDPSLLQFVWCRDRCTQTLHPELRELDWIKNLSKLKRLGRRLEHTLILDDTPSKLRRHYGNLLRISPFVGSNADTELRDVLPFLHHLRSVPNVRTIEKRDWRDKVRHLPPVDTEFPHVPLADFPRHPAS